MSEKSEAEYLDLLQRAAKIRHYLAKNPRSTYEQITLHFRPMKCPVAWLVSMGYVLREKNPNPEGGMPVYSPKPLGIPFDPLDYDLDKEDDEFASASEKIRASGVEEI